MNEEVQEQRKKTNTEKENREYFLLRHSIPMYIGIHYSKSDMKDISKV